jgi:molybdopterin converting factor small subunit
MIVVRLPPGLAEEVGAPTRASLGGAAADVAAVIAALEARYPAIRRRLTEADGELRPHIAVFVDDLDARRHGGVRAPVRDGAEVWFLRAISGG